MLQRHLREDVVRRPHRIDYSGAAVLTVALPVLILALLEGGVDWSWTSPASLSLFATAAVLLAVFAWTERRAADPILPPWVFTVAGCVLRQPPSRLTPDCGPLPSPAS